MNNARNPNKRLARKVRQQRRENRVLRLQLDKRNEMVESLREKLTDANHLIGVLR